MKTLLTIIVLYLCAGCSRPDFQNGFTVTEIKRVTSDRCIYYSQSGACIYDDCGKFTVGDTLKLTK